MKIIFDLDDTLYQNKELREKRDEAIIKFLGDQAPSFNELKKSHGTLKSLEMLGISREKFYEIVEKVPISLKPDLNLRKMLEKIKAGRKMIVISNISSKIACKTLEKLGIRDLFDEVHGGDRFKQSKPAEENFSLVEPGDLCIGNNFEKDLEIPKRKGATTVLISPQPNQEAHFNISSIHELGNLFK